MPNESESTSNMRKKRSFKAKVADLLRKWADRVDDETALVCFSGYFNIYRGEGMVVTTTGGVQVHPPVPGTRLYYFHDEYRGIEG